MAPTRSLGGEVGVTHALLGVEGSGGACGQAVAWEGPASVRDQRMRPCAPKATSALALLVGQDFARWDVNSKALVRKRFL